MTGKCRYEPNWDSLDKRPNPSWYDEAKFGIFIHWGVFSVPSFGSEWFWNYWHGGQQSYVDFVKDNYRPGWTYADFARDFTAEFYNATQWTEIFKAAGARYIVFVSKHHEGFCNWPTNVSFNWNSKAVGPNRDIVGELASAIRKDSDIHFGIYHSLFEWFNPVYLGDAERKFTTQEFVNRKTMPELYELVNTYKPDIVWSDGDGGVSYKYWKSEEFIAWLFNDSPVKDTVLTNDRWGSGTMCKHGSFLTCADRYVPGKPLKKKWENAMTIDKRSWGYRREAKLDELLTIEELIQLFVKTISLGGNMLMNVGPTHDGRIAPIYEERLRQFGQWMKINEEGIYGSKIWSSQNDSLSSTVWYTSKNDAIYAFLLEWPKDNQLKLGSVNGREGMIIEMLGYGSLTWKSAVRGVIVDLDIPAIKLPTRWAWTLKIKYSHRRIMKMTVIN